MSEDEIQLVAKIALGLVCFLGVCLVGYGVFSMLHAFYSSATSLLQVAGH